MGNEIPICRRRLLKAKSGCATCKSRRVKCDETKPYCHRCTRFGRKCGGYPATEPPTSKAVSVAIGPPTQSIASASDRSSRSTSLGDLIRQPQECIPLTDDKEARVFQVFREQTAHELAGAFQLSLWDRLLLQASRYEPFARHAAVALGALSMSHKLRCLAHGSGHATFSDADDYQAFALCQYGKALRCMRKAIADPNNDLWKALLSCLVVYCFESFHGRKDLAISHAQSGQRFFQDTMRSWKVSRKREPILDVDLVQAFSRLDLLLMTAFDTRSRSLHDSFAYKTCTPLSQMPPCFKSVAIAKIYLERLMQHVGHFLAFALGFQDPADSFERQPEVPQETKTQMGFGLSIFCYQGRVIPSKLANQYAECVKYLEHWSASFELLDQKEQLEGTVSKDWLPMSRLQIHYRVLKIALLAANFASERSYDNHFPDFRAIITQARPIIELEAKMTEASFNFDLSIIAPLGYVAMHCRHWTVRREALQLLEMETRKKELFWERKLLLGQSRFLMETEEEGLNFGEYIPEVKRARMLAIKTNESKRCAIVSVAKGKRGIGDGEVVRDRVIEW